MKYKKSFSGEPETDESDFWIEKLSSYIKKGWLRSFMEKQKISKLKLASIQKEEAAEKVVNTLSDVAKKNGIEVKYIREVNDKFSLIVEIMENKE